MPATPVTPFIPPLPGDPSPRPDSRRPLVPDGGGPAPAWYQPGMPPAPPPGSYFPAPVGLPGVSEDWVGFGGPPPPSGWTAQPHLPPGTPWHHPATGYMGYAPLPPQMGYGMGPPPPMGPMGHMGPMGPMGYYPGTPWHGNGTMPPTPGGGQGYDPATGAMRSRQRYKDDGVMDTQFMVGKHYGPVLEPLVVGAVGAKPKLNPLLTPPPEDHKKRDYIKWNMLFSSSFAQRSGDAAHLSWSRGRDEPATWPRVASLRLLSRAFPWVVDVRARRGDVGVTCGDLIDTLSEFLLSHCASAEFAAAPREVQRRVGAAYHHHRSRADDVPGGRMGAGLLRADWLCQESMFMGIERDPEFVKKRLEISGKMELPCVWVLRCGRRFALTEEEVREQELRTQAEERMRREAT